MSRCERFQLILGACALVAGFLLMEGNPTGEAVAAGKPTQDGFTYRDVTVTRADYIGPTGGWVSGTCTDEEKKTCTVGCQLAGKRGHLFAVECEAKINTNDTGSVPEERRVHCTCLRMGVKALLNFP